MSLRFPPWFVKKYPELMKNLQTNIHRLTTPFDIHETLHEIVSFSGVEGRLILCYVLIIVLQGCKPYNVDQWYY